MKMTKAYHAFITKINYFYYDIEFVDVIKRTNPNDCIFKNITRQNHPVLSNRDNTSDLGRGQIINHLENTIYSSFVKDVYEEVMLYFKTIMQYVIERGGIKPEIILAGDKMEITYKDVLKKGSWNKIIEHIAKNLVRKVEKRKDTSYILNEIPKRLGIEVSKDKINEVMPFLEVRHLLVHNDGKMDDKFKSSYPNMFASKQNDRINIDFAFIKDFKNKTINLIKLYDNELVLKQLISEKDIHAHAQRNNVSHLIKSTDGI